MDISKVARGGPEGTALRARCRAAAPALGYRDDSALCRGAGATTSCAEAGDKVPGAEYRGDSALSGFRGSVLIGAGVKRPGGLRAAAPSGSRDEMPRQVRAAAMPRES